MNKNKYFKKKYKENKTEYIREITFLLKDVNNNYTYLNDFYKIGEHKTLIKEFRNYIGFSSMIINDKINYIDFFDYVKAMFSAVKKIMRYIKEHEILKNEIMFLKLKNLFRFIKRRLKIIISIT